jgi:hypothetical protein
MVTYKQKKPQDEQEEEVYSTESGGSDPDYDTDPVQVTALLKRLEAISQDCLSRRNQSHG